MLNAVASIDATEGWVVGTSNDLYSAAEFPTSRLFVAGENDAVLNRGTCKVSLEAYPMGGLAQKRHRSGGNASFARHYDTLGAFQEDRD